jgi:hypothetical protein
VIYGNQRTLFSKIQVLNLLMHKFHLIYLISQLELKKDIKTLKLSETYQQDQMVTCSIIQNIPQEQMG